MVGFDLSPVSGEGDLAAGGPPFIAAITPLLLRSGNRWQKRAVLRRNIIWGTCITSVKV